MRRAFVFLALVACTTAHADAPPPVGTASEIAATPRADPELERLALMVDRTKLTVDQASYERVARDVGAIRAQDANAANVHFEAPPFDADPHVIVLEFDPAVSTTGYADWDSLNAAYRMKLDLAEGVVELRTDALFNLELLMPLYAKLRGVTSVKKTVFGGIPENQPARLCVRQSPAAWDYLFITELQGFAYPPEVTPRIASWFSVDTNGVITSSDHWTEDEHGSAPPTAATSICDRDTN